MTPFYLYVPAVVLAVWLGHAVWSWTRPHRRDPFGVLLLAGLPVATVVAFVAFALAHDPGRGQYDALPPGGALLIAEKLLTEDKLSPLTTQLQSLNMLICTDGKERSLSEYGILLHNSGFSNLEGRHTGAPVDAILAFK